MRNTVHLVTAEDFGAFRALFQPLMDRGSASRGATPQDPPDHGALPAPGYDNLLPPGHGATGGTLLVDELWQADWKITKGILHSQPFIWLRRRPEAVAAEGSGSSTHGIRGY